MERQPRVDAYPAWRRAFWRAVAGSAYQMATTAYDVGGWAMGHLPECRLNRERAARILAGVQKRVASHRTGEDAHDY